MFYDGSKGRTYSYNETMFNRLEKLYENHEDSEKELNNVLKKIDPETTAHVEIVKGEITGNYYNYAIMFIDKRKPYANTFG